MFPISRANKDKMLLKLIHNNNNTLTVCVSSCNDGSSLKSLDDL